MTAANRGGGSRGTRHIFPKRLLLKYGQDFPLMSWCLASGNDAIIRSRPFDGMFMNLSVNGPKVMDPTQNVTTSAVAAEISGWGGLNLGQCLYNFAAVRILQTNMPDWWNDSQWFQIQANWATFATALKAEGQIVGIVFDDEVYSATVPTLWDWGSTGFGTGAQPSAPGSFGDSGNINPANVPNYGADPTHTLAQSRAKAQARGKQVMDAVRSTWPDIKIIVLHGPYASTTLTAAALNPPAYNDVAFANELEGSFFGGMVESCIGTPAAIIDGGELYQVRSRAEQLKCRQWQLKGLPRSAQTVFSSTVANNYRIGAGQGIFDKDFNNSPTYPVQSAAAVQAQLVDAMRTSDIAWFYTEVHQWYGPVFPAEHVSIDTDPTFRDAVIAARDLGRR